MNYFGLFFSFLLPGIIIGLLMGAWIFRDIKKSKPQKKSVYGEREAVCKQPVCGSALKPRSGLYIHSVLEDANKPKSAQQKQSSCRVAA